LQVADILTAAEQSATSAQMLHRHTLATIAILVPAFAIGGALSRYSLRTTETRWQIAAFAALAIGVEGIARLSGPHRASVIRCMLNAAAATIVIVSVKFHLEPEARKNDSAIVRHVAKTVVNAAIKKR
jgi:hypothetical protein